MPSESNGGKPVIRFMEGFFGKVIIFSFFKGGMEQQRRFKAKAKSKKEGNMLATKCN